MFQLAIIIGKCIYYFSKLLNLGAGGTWPGEIALKFDSSILSKFLPKFKKGIIIIAGTNGKTTTSLMIKQILESNSYQVIHNATGANLLNGIISSIIIQSNWLGRLNADWGVFETDENTLPLFVKELKTQNSMSKIVVVLLNLFRDQLDRYGEVDVIVEKWNKALNKLEYNTQFILNADDPGIAYLGTRLKNVKYFGIEDKLKQNKLPDYAMDSSYCMNCGAKLNYSTNYFSHLGIWKCDQCKMGRPKIDYAKTKEILPGLYNYYNTLAAIAVGDVIGIEQKNIEAALENFKPAFGRQEEFTIAGKQVKIFLSKNPAGFNASLRTVIDLMRLDSRLRGNDKNDTGTIILALNDQIPDGRDISWIWDVDFEILDDNINIICTGDRAWDMGLRIKYADESQKLKGKSQNLNEKLKIIQSFEKAIEEGLNNIDSSETLYVLATYSAMLNVRKILRGRRIL